MQHQASEESDSIQSGNSNDRRVSLTRRSMYGGTLFFRENWIEELTGNE